MTKQTLPPIHTSFETAYEVVDYPYGFTLRTKMRIWIETKKRHGQRVVSCTLNPKVAGEKWNKPKAGTYSQMAVLFINSDNGHVESDGFSAYSADKAAAFLSDYSEGLTDYQRGKLIILEALVRSENITGKTIYGSDQETRNEIWNKAMDILISEGHEDLTKKIVR